MTLTLKLVFPSFKLSFSRMSVLFFVDLQTSPKQPRQNSPSHSGDVAPEACDVRLTTFVQVQRERRHIHQTLSAENASRHKPCVEASGATGDSQGKQSRGGWKATGWLPVLPIASPTFHQKHPSTFWGTLPRTWATKHKSRREFVFTSHAAQNLNPTWASLLHCCSS